jgi:hypothetical protein
MKPSWSLRRVKKDTAGNKPPVKKAMIDCDQIEVSIIYKAFDK